jgi:hypothetical protein
VDVSAEKAADDECEPRGDGGEGTLPFLRGGSSRGSGTGTGDSVEMEEDVCTPSSSAGMFSTVMEVPHADGVMTAASTRVGEGRGSTAAGRRRPFQGRTVHLSMGEEGEGYEGGGGTEDAARLSAENGTMAVRWGEDGRGRSLRRKARTAITEAATMQVSATVPVAVSVAYSDVMRKPGDCGVAGGGVGGGSGGGGGAGGGAGGAKGGVTTAEVTSTSTDGRVSANAELSASVLSACVTGAVAAAIPAVRTVDVADKAVAVDVSTLNPCAVMALAITSSTFSNEKEFAPTS